MVIFDKNLTMEDIIARRDIVIHNQLAEIERLTNRTTRLEKALQSVEWGGSREGFGMEFSCCPECGNLWHGTKKKHIEKHLDIRLHRCIIGHDDDCKLAAALKPEGDDDKSS